MTAQERDTAVADVRPIMKELAAKYGEDIQLLQMPDKATGKEKLSCDMVQEMWAKVLQLPESCRRRDSAGGFRAGVTMVAGFLGT